MRHRGTMDGTDRNVDPRDAEQDWCVVDGGPGEICRHHGGQNYDESAVDLHGDGHVRISDRCDGHPCDDDVHLHVLTSPHYAHAQTSINIHGGTDTSTVPPGQWRRQQSVRQ